MYFHANLDVFENYKLMKEDRNLLFENLKNQEKAEHNKFESNSNI